VVLDDELDAYLTGLVPDRDSVLRDMEAHGERDDIPIVPPETGRLLEILTRASGARRVIEVGTAIGVSTLCIARALPPEGRIVTFDVDAERHAAARTYLERAGVLGRVDLRLQPAIEGLRGLEGPFDMAFIDAVKTEYPAYLELVVPLLRPGGLILIDNALMRRAVLPGSTSSQGFSPASVEAMRAINASLRERADIEGAIVPVGDGLIVAVTRAG
jgi:predicted O-methyltransferase YrrM